MYSILTRFLFGPSEPPPITKLAQVCDKNKILSDKVAQVLQGKFKQLLKPKQYVVFGHCSVQCCSFINVSYVDEEGDLYRHSWSNEKETAVYIKQLNDLGYVQKTFTERSLLNESKKL